MSSVAICLGAAFGYVLGRGMATSLDVVRMLFIGLSLAVLASNLGAPFGAVVTTFLTTAGGMFVGRASTVRYRTSPLLEKLLFPVCGVIAVMDVVEIFIAMH